MTLDYEKTKCPKCGATLQNVVLTVEPPIHLAKCPECGFEKRVEPYGKPPLGCSPYYVNISARICDLCDAIKRHATGTGTHNKVLLWAKEIIYLNEMDRSLKHDEKQRTWVENRDGTLREAE